MGILSVILQAGSWLLGHGLRWMYLLLGFIVVEAVFRVVVAKQWLNGLSELIIYLQNIALFKMIPEIGIVWILNAFMFMMSLEMLWMVIEHKHQSKSHEHDNNAKK